MNPKGTEVKGAFTDTSVGEPHVRRHHMADTPSIRLLGLRNPVAMEQYSASSLVDVAYIRATGSDSADVFLDDGIDFQKQGAREWISEILRISLSECGETEAQIEFVSG